MPLPAYQEALVGPNGATMRSNCRVCKDVCIELRYHDLANVSAVQLHFNLDNLNSNLEIDGKMVARSDLFIEWAKNLVVARTGINKLTETRA
jgi:hypothetical protein